MITLIGLLINQPTAKEIFKRIDDVLKLANTSIEELDFLAVGIGPGRFSGLRVSISAIKSISYVLNILSLLPQVSRLLLER